MIQLFDGLGHYRDTHRNNGAFVGLKLTISKPIRILAIGTQFKDKTTVNLLVNEYPLEINHNKANMFDWHECNIVANGDLTIGYQQGNVESIRYKANWNVAPCGSCNAKNARHFAYYSPFIKVVGFEDDYISNTSNFGLNIRFEFV